MLLQFESRKWKFSESSVMLMLGKYYYNSGKYKSKILILL